MSRTLSIIGITITLVYFAILGFIFNGRLTEILLMPPNEIGDLLAGMFGPLAILWLILGFFQQGMELRQNTEALKLQEKSLWAQVAELNASVEQQKELVATSRRQLEAEIEGLNQEKQRKMQEDAANFVFYKGFMREVSKDQFICDITMKNVGNTATNVRLSSSTHEIHAIPDEISSLSSGDQHRMSWKQGSPEKSIGQLIKVEYQDASGRHREENFAVDVFQNKLSNSISFSVRLTKSQF